MLGDLQLKVDEITELDFYALKIDNGFIGN